MFCCIMGNGHAGRMHREILRTMPFDFLFVDKQNKVQNSVQLPSLSSIPNPLKRKVFVWDICSPTDTHMEFLREILQLDPSANIILEKPVCGSHEIQDFLDLLTRHSQARIFVNDLYSHSNVIKVIKDKIAIHCSGEQLREIYVEFTKNRMHDIINGRFVDLDFGLLGYEWLHMLTLVKQILRLHQAGEYFSSMVTKSTFEPCFDDAYFLTNLKETTSLAGLPKVTLYSSILGRINRPIKHILEHIGPDYCIKEKILYKSEFRYRILHLLYDNTEIVTQFEPIIKGSYPGLIRNKHCVYAFKDGNLIDESIVSDNHLSNSLYFAINYFRRDVPLGGGALRYDIKPQIRIANIANFLRSTYQENMRIHSGRGTMLTKPCVEKR